MLILMEIKNFMERLASTPFAVQFVKSFRYKLCSFTCTEKPLVFSAQQNQRFCALEILDFYAQEILYMGFLCGTSEHQLIISIFLTLSTAKWTFGATPSNPSPLKTWFYFCYRARLGS